MKSLFTIVAFLVSINLFAQNVRTERAEKIEALYIAFITRELKLTEEEAQKFWPVHTQYDDETRNIKADMPELDRQQAILNIMKKYQDRFSKIIGNGRTDDFFRKDAEFRKKLTERLGKMRRNGQQFRKRN